MNQYQYRPYSIGLLAGLFLAIGITSASLVLARTWIHIRESQVVEVTGSARKDIRSDLVVWTGCLTEDDPTLSGAYTKLQTDLSQIDRFLRSKGYGTYELAPVQVQTVTARSKEAEGEDILTRRLGFQLTQPVVIRSSDVIGLPKLGSECASMLEHGIAFTAQDVQFIYTKAGQTKVEMVAAAAEDARTRAEQVAARGGRKIREMRSAHMGVVQINPLYSSAVSWEGNNDTSSLDKTIMVTVSAEFSLK